MKEKLDPGSSPGRRGEVVRPLADQFYGERSGTVRDPFGYEWSVGHEIEKLTPAEMQRRYEAMMAG